MKNRKDSDARYYRKVKEKRKIQMREYARKTKEKMRVMNKNYYEKHKKEIISKKIIFNRQPQIVAKNRVRHPAQYRISLKGKRCEVCGSTKNLQRHHPDYSKPLKVEILCGEHHGEKHGKY